jgi:hypothetical protein
MGSIDHTLPNQTTPKQSATPISQFQAAANATRQSNVSLLCVSH